MNVAVASAAVVVRRTIAANAEDIFDAWLDPKALAVWMRPGTLKSTTAKVDARVGGQYEIVMQGESERFPHSGVYRCEARPAFQRALAAQLAPFAKHAPAEAA